MVQRKTQKKVPNPIAKCAVWMKLVIQTLAAFEMYVHILKYNYANEYFNIHEFRDAYELWFCMCVTHIFLNLKPLGFLPFFIKSRDSAHFCKSMLNSLTLRWLSLVPFFYYYCIASSVVCSSHMAVLLIK